MKFLAGDELFDTINKYSNQRALILRKLGDFLRFKESNPYNGSAPGGAKFGDTDKKFRAGGRFSDKIDGISHAHLTHDISIVYRIIGDTIYLYGVYTHDAIGTGNPPSTARQLQASSRWTNSTFSDLDPTSLAAPSADTKKTEPAAKARQTKKPEPKSTSSAAPTLGKRIADAVERAESVYPQRNFARKWSAANTTPERNELLRNEANALLQFKKSAGQLYPNQLQYVDTLTALYNIINS